MPQYIAARYSDRSRYLTKALREIARRTTRLVGSLDDRLLREVPPGEEWSVAEIVGYIRDSEHEDLRALSAMARIDGAHIEERRAMHGPAEGRYRFADVAELLWEFATLREETIWLLETAGSAWHHVGIHPYRGEVPFEQWVQEINERDLDAMWRIQRIRDLLRPAGVPPVTGMADV
jgi:hypothetical protein